MNLTDREESRLIEELVARYVTNRDIFKALGGALFEVLNESEDLRRLVHSIKYRVKDPDHLRDKLQRKLRDEKLLNRKRFSVTPKNIFQEINDLTGVRILHLHTTQIESIDIALRKCLTSQNYELAEGPTAKTWDDESRSYFQSLNIETETSKTQYTSVHYVFNVKNDTKATFEIQVRTLAEELWGEVDHLINYPHRHKLLACTEQIAVLARATSTCTRLVDAIFQTHTEFLARESRPVGPARKKRIENPRK